MAAPHKVLDEAKIGSSSLLGLMVPFSKIHQILIRLAKLVRLSTCPLYSAIYPYSLPVKLQQFVRIFFRMSKIESPKSTKIFFLGLNNWKDLINEFTK